jgi:hypothetical protein
MIMSPLQHREISAMTAAALWWPWPRLISQIVAPQFTAAGVQRCCPDCEKGPLTWDDGAC